MAPQRGTRLSKDWKPNESDLEFARSFGLDEQFVIDEFRDYWLSLPGEKARKIDWHRTFRNSIRLAAVRFRHLPEAQAKPRPVELTEERKEMLATVKRRVAQVKGMTERAARAPKTHTTEELFAEMRRRMG